MYILYAVFGFFIFLWIQLAQRNAIWPSLTVKYNHGDDTFRPWATFDGIIMILTVIILGKKKKACCYCCCCCCGCWYQFIVWKICNFAVNALMYFHLQRSSSSSSIIVIIGRFNVELFPALASSHDTLSHWARSWEIAAWCVHDTPAD